MEDLDGFSEVVWDLDHDHANADPHAPAPVPVPRDPLSSPPPPLSTATAAAAATARSGSLSLRSPWSASGPPSPLQEAPSSFVDMGPGPARGDTDAPATRGAPGFVPTTSLASPPQRSAQLLDHPSIPSPPAPTGLGATSLLAGDPIAPPPAPPAPPLPAPPSSIGNNDLLTSFHLLSAARSPYEVTIDDPQKHGEGLKDAYVSYLVSTRDLARGSTHAVRRRFTDFVWLHGLLVNEYPTAIVCPLPDKHRMEYITGDRFSAEFVEKRRLSLQRFLHRIVRHPVLQTSVDVRRFLTMPDWILDASKPPKKSNDTGVLENLSSTLLPFTSTSTHAKHKRPDDRFTHTRETMARLDDHLHTLERLTNRVIKKHLDLEHELADVAAGLTALGVLEPDLTEALTHVGAVVYEVAQATAACTHREDVDFTSHVRDYLAYCAAVRQAVRARDAKHAHFENCEAALAAAVAELDKARGGNGASAPSAPAAPAAGGGLLSAAVAASSSAGAFFKEKYEEISGADAGARGTPKADKVARLEAKVRDAHAAVDAARDDHVATSDAVAKEVDYFQAARSADFKEIFSDYADGQIEYFERSLRLWESMIPALDAIRLDD
ncbi:intercellular trafficking and secretion [Allomyces arbusculus]|nr:intercellular trafficking and secretion [Allomyces arbusculus]